MKDNLFDQVWRDLEKKQPLPRRMREIYFMPFDILQKKITEQDLSFISSLITSLYSGDVYVFKNTYSPEFMKKIRAQLEQLGKKTHSEFYPMIEGCPNYHRIIDKEIVKKYTFESIKHSFYFFPWNKDDFGIFKEAYPSWRLIKLLSGLNPDEYEKNTPKDGIVDRIQIVHYPTGAGRIETHSDPYQVHRLIISCFMTKRGVDYSSGGVYFLNKDNKKIDVEDRLDVGDMQIYFPTILHGVETIDPEAKLDWTSSKGRWWFGPFSNSSNMVEKRHTGFGVKEL